MQNSLAFNMRHVPNWDIWGTANAGLSICSEYICANVCTISWFRGGRQFGGSAQICINLWVVAAIIVDLLVLLVTAVAREVYVFRRPLQVGTENTQPQTPVCSS